MARPLGVAVDLENLRDGLSAILALLRLLDLEGGEVHLVGARWAQDLIPEDELPPGWWLRRDLTSPESEAADDAIHALLTRWREEGRVAVVASSDGGFAESLSAHRRCGVASFVVTTGRPARRLGRAAPVHVLSAPAVVEAAARAIEEAR